MCGGLPIERQSSAGHNLEYALSEELPATIKYAIQVVLQLGYRYLWVDKYCINQFDKDDKRKQIAMIDMVYNKADVTIIAAAGMDPSFGLPGMGHRARSVQPCIELNGQVWISNRGDVEAVIKKSKWFKRGLDVPGSSLLSSPADLHSRSKSTTNAITSISVRMLILIYTNYTMSERYRAMVFFPVDLVPFVMAWINILSSTPRESYHGQTML